MLPFDCIKSKLDSRDTTRRQVGNNAETILQLSVYLSSVGIHTDKRNRLLLFNYLTETFFTVDL